MDTQLTANQKAARMGMMFSLTVPLTSEEIQAIDTPYAEWPQSLKDKAGEMGRLVENEDLMAKEQASLPPDAAPSLEK